MTFDTALIVEHIPDFLRAAGMSLRIGGIAIVLSFAVAVIYSVILYFEVPYIQKLIRLHVELARPGDGNLGPGEISPQAV